MDTQLIIILVTINIKEIMLIVIHTLKGEANMFLRKRCWLKDGSYPT